MISFLPDLYMAFEDCLGDIKTLTLIGQTFVDAKELVKALSWLFRDAMQFKFVELVDCQIGRDTKALQSFICEMSRFVLLSQKGEI